MAVPVKIQNQTLIYAPVLRVFRVLIARWWTIPAPPHLVFMGAHVWSQQEVHSLANVPPDGLAPRVILVSRHFFSFLN